LAEKELGQAVIVLTTTASLSEARRLSHLLLSKRVIACANMIPSVLSSYWWQGKIEHSKEVLLFLKTIPSRLPALTRLLKSHHSYEVPELLIISVAAADQVYLKWLIQNVAHTT